MSATGVAASLSQPRPPEAICRKCGLPIECYGSSPGTGTYWAVAGTGTTADGLSYCPPDPDHRGRLGCHVPRRGNRTAPRT